MANTPTIQSSSASLLAADVGILPPITQLEDCDGNSAVDTATSHQLQTHRLVHLVTLLHLTPLSRFLDWQKRARETKER